MAMFLLNDNVHNLNKQKENEEETNQFSYLLS